MNSRILRSALKKNKISLIVHSIIVTSIVLVGVGLFSKLGKTGFALGVVGFISLAAFSLLFMSITVHDISNDIKTCSKVTKDRIKFMTMFTVPSILGTMLIGTCLFGNELDSNVRSITSIAGFVALSLLVLFSTIRNLKCVNTTIKNESYENSIYKTQHTVFNFTNNC